LDVTKATAEMKISHPRWPFSTIAERLTGVGQHLLGPSLRRTFVTEPVGLEEVPPGRNVWAALQESSALPFGHTTPNTEFSLVVECIGKTFRHDGATITAFLGQVLGSPPDK
jgi:hypothetical protein